MEQILNDTSTTNIVSNFIKHTNGKVEQYGYYSGSGSVTLTVNFLKSFSARPIVTCGNGTSSSGTYNSNCEPNTITVSSFTIWANSYLSYYAIGY